MGDLEVPAVESAWPQPRMDRMMKNWSSQSVCSSSRVVVGRWPDRSSPTRSTARANRDIPSLVADDELDVGVYARRGRSTVGS